MRRGCIAMGKIECDGCHKSLNYGERYLIMDDDEGAKQRLCVDCCLARGYASYITDKGKETITFAPKQ